MGQIDRTHGAAESGQSRAGCALLARRPRRRSLCDAGCGSGTKTVSVASTPPSAAATQRDGNDRHDPILAHHATTPTQHQRAHERTGGADAHAHRARARVHAAGIGRRRRAERARRRSCGRTGYTPNDTSQYHPNQTLRVLVGTRTGSGDGYGQQAFFFVDGRYIGTDTSQPSATREGRDRQGDTEVTLAYPLYRKQATRCAARAAGRRRCTSS